MHPHLEGERFVSCYELIQALNECHQRAFLSQAVGACNIEKDSLSRCLHEARIDGVNQNINKSKEANAIREQKIRQMREEEFGEGEYLKKLLQEKIKERDLKLSKQKAEENK
ncbi:hypothetical protein ACO0SA_002759 [Hanseniaspora valbyensis]|uniref:COX assembly mitochondrial protein n=1 Tax=Hanseniaspora valbyensis NRRL Y-1626 TaxID=766949 RepID=A0A1B7TJR8_9ASCO|nr:UPF0287-domain-containing protein [Hanseniaspora valbyensis NRRL Y-1626]